MHIRFHCYRTPKPATMTGLLPAKGAAARPEPLPNQAPQPPAVGRAKPARVIRIPLTVKVSETVYRRLREASFREETNKQDLIDQAIDALLTQMGY